MDKISKIKKFYKPYENKLMYKKAKAIYNYLNGPEWSYGPELNYTGSLFKGRNCFTFIGLNKIVDII